MYSHSLELAQALTPPNMVRATVHKHKQHDAHKRAGGYILDFDDPRSIFTTHYPKVIDYLSGQDVNHLRIESGEPNNTPLLVARPVDVHDRLLPLPAIDLRYRALRRIPGLVLPRYVDYIPDVNVEEEIGTLPTIGFVFPDDD